MADSATKVDPKAHAQRQESYEQQIKSVTLAVEQRKELWAALNAYIRDNGCHVVSKPGDKYLRFEMPRGSSLPAKLIELGYSPRHLNTDTRLQTGAFQPVDIIEITLPGK